MVNGLDKLAQSSSYAEQGTPASGYEENGPYHCDNCIHKTAPDEPYCNHPEVVADKKLKDRLVNIDGHNVVKINMERGCCKFVNQSKEGNDGT
jgi:hypothetical protein